VETCPISFLGRTHIRQATQFTFCTLHEN
jgi:hypothetical protein